MDQSWPEAGVFNQFEQQVKNLIILARDEDQRRAWRVERILSNHILIRFGLHYGSRRPRWYSLVWPKNARRVQKLRPSRWMSRVASRTIA